MTAARGATLERADSMSLLRQIYDDALEPEYEAARARGGRRPSRRSTTFVWAVVLSLFAAMLTAVWANSGAPEAVTARARLVVQVQNQTAAVDRLSEKVNQQQVAVAQLRDAALAQSLEGAGLSSSVAQLQLAAGQTAVTGPGVHVDMDDGPPTSSEPGGTDLARVLDQDVRMAVNGLFAAGAEAVAVNGQRITSLTSIRSAGGAILVGYRPLTPPYVITAIGSPATMAARFAVGADASALRDLAATYGMRFDVTSSAEVTVPGGTDATLRYAHPTKELP